MAGPPVSRGGARAWVNGRFAGRACEGIGVLGLRIKIRITNGEGVGCGRGFPGGGRLHFVQEPVVSGMDAKDHYQFQVGLKQIWGKAVVLYQDGNRDSGRYFSAEELEFLRSVGHTAQEVYDFAEDWVSGGQPDRETFLLIASVRRSYFLEEMGGQWSDRVVDTGDLPAKEDSVRGVEWLPRIIPKAKAKLRGEMSADLMYCCGGDRKFFRRNNIHPAEFLDLVRRHWDDESAIIDWVLARSPTAAQPANL